jgi:H+-transporting ATPase
MKSRLAFAGLLAIYDSATGDSAETIKTAQKMGKHVIMVTGDHIAIAKEISKDVYLGSTCCLHLRLSTSLTAKSKVVVENADGSQRFSPSTNTHVQLLQEQGHIVGMTGDGVNDAPALRRRMLALP